VVRTVSLALPITYTHFVVMVTPTWPSNVH